MLGDNRATALFNHVRALEALQEVKDEAAADFNERKKLCKEDGFDTNVVAAILKRRKNGEGQTRAFDDLLREYEDAIEEQRLPSPIRAQVIVHRDEDPEPQGQSETSLFDDESDGVRP